MTVDKIKLFIENNMNHPINFKFNGSRNQIEEFSGEIVNTYKSVFIIKVDGVPITKSFSYTDILIGNLELTLQ